MAKADEFDITVSGYDPNLDVDSVVDYSNFTVKEGTKGVCESVKNVNEVYVCMSSLLVVTGDVLEVNKLRVDTNSTMFIKGNVQCRKIWVDRNGDLLIGGNVDCSTIECDRKGVLKVAGNTNASRIKETRDGQVEEGVRFQPPQY